MLLGILKYLVILGGPLTFETEGLDWLVWLGTIEQVCSPTEISLSAWPDQGPMDPGLPAGFALGFYGHQKGSKLPYPRCQNIGSCLSANGGLNWTSLWDKAALPFCSFCYPL